MRDNICAGKLTNSFPRIFFTISYALLDEPFKNQVFFILTSIQLTFGQLSSLVQRARSTSDLMCSLSKKKDLYIPITIIIFSFHTHTGKNHSSLPLALFHQFFCILFFHKNDDSCNSCVAYVTSNILRQGTRFPGT